MILFVMFFEAAALLGARFAVMLKLDPWLHGIQRWKLGYSHNNFVLRAVHDDGDALLPGFDGGCVSRGGSQKRLPKIARIVLGGRNVEFGDTNGRARLRDATNCDADNQDSHDNQVSHDASYAD
ncbi:MAG: hypothetical protein ABI789_03590 [Usitatibacter sp.]